jgi:hypothetical protein
MALGISERMIQRAFGAQDLSPIYNTLSAANQRIAAEDRARKIEAEKRYYTELADINKQKIGSRTADIEDITKDYNRWSAIGKQLSSNPLLITRNPEQYGKLKSESDALYSKMLTNIQDSKEFAQYERTTYQKMVDPNNLDDWDEGAADRFKADVLGKPISYIRQNNTDNMSSYYRKTVDGGKFYQSLPNALSAISKYDPEIIDETSKTVDGVTKVFQYKNLIPSVDVARNAVEIELNATIPQSQINKFAKQELDKAIESKDYDKTIVDFTKLYNDNQKKFKLPALPDGMFDESLPPKAKLINLLAAKQFISSYANPNFKRGDIVDKVAFADSQRAKSVADQIAKEGRAAAKGASKPTSEVFSIAPLFRMTAATGQSGVDGMENASSQFNSIGFDYKLYPFTASEAYQNIGSYSIGSELAMGDKNIKNYAKIKDPRSEEGRKAAENLAAAVNRSNKENGFFETDVTPQSLTSGRVMVMTIKDKENKNVNVYLNTTGPNSAKYVDVKIKPPQMSARQKRESIGAAITPTSSVGGYSYVIDENGDVKITYE